MNGIFKDKRIIFVLSLAISFVLWLTVSLVLRPTGEVVIQGVGVNVNVQSGILGDLGLSAIEGAESTVNVTISGPRSVIGGVSAEDISVSPSLSGVSGAGSYELDLRAVNNSSRDFEIVGISPATINVKFDKYVDKTVKLHHKIIGEYNIPDEFIQEETYTDIREVIVTGPEIDLENVYSAIVIVELNGDYSGTTAVEGEVILLDNLGNEIEYKKNEISLNFDTATVYIPVHKNAILPVNFEYTNVPEYFNTSSLKYIISHPEILVEGEDHTIDKYSDIFLGYVDIRDINLENSSVSFGVKLPAGFTTPNYTDEVEVEFDLEGYIESNFNATQINIINVPKGYKITSNSSKVSVTLIGPEEAINGISAKDIVVQIDMSTREIVQTGQYRVQAEILIPGVDNVWATGVYYMTITVKEK